MTTFIAPDSGSRRSVWRACTCSWVRKPRGRPVISNAQRSPPVSAPLSTTRTAIPTSGISSSSADFAIVCLLPAPPLGANLLDCQSTAPGTPDQITSGDAAGGDVVLLDQVAPIGAAAPT